MPNAHQILTLSKSYKLRKSCALATHLEHIFLNVFNIVLPVLICIGLGYWLAIIKAPFDNKVIGELISRVGFPTLVISHITTARIDAAVFLNVIGAAALTVVGFGILSFVAFKFLKISVPAFLGPFMHGNVGSVGLPITLLTFGGTGMAYTMGFVVVVLLSMFSVGIWIPSRRISLKTVLASPVIYAAFVALALVVTDTALPKPLASSLDILGGLAIPLLLLTMGHTLATFRIGKLGQSVLLASVHLVIAVAVALSVVRILGLTGTERGVVILCCLMPSSVANYLFADQYLPDEAPDVAGFILVSTVVSVLVLPLALTFWV